jgi:gas vesicle protein
MFSRVKIAIRFFFMGLAVGILLAPRSGRETRRLLREKADQLLNDVLDAATLGTYDNGGAQRAATDASGSRGGNGRGKSRTTSTTSATPTEA